MATNDIPADASEIVAKIAANDLSVDDLAAAYAKLRAEADAAKKAIAGAHHPGQEENQLEIAAIDLESVVWTMQEATHEILYSAEQIDDAVTKLESDDDSVDRAALRKAIADHVTKLFESCNFQDLTGQRINYIINTVTATKSAINGAIDSFGADAFAAIPVPEAGISDDVQMSGPDLSGKAASQADIDALFS